MFSAVQLRSVGRLFSSTASKFVPLADRVLVRNLQSYWTTTKPWELTVVLDYYEAKETYRRIGLLRSHGNLQSCWTTTKPSKLTVVFQVRLLKSPSATSGGVYLPESVKQGMTTATVISVGPGREKLGWNSPLVSS